MKSEQSGSELWKYVTNKNVKEPNSSGQSDSDNGLERKSIQVEGSLSHLFQLRCKIPVNQTNLLVKYLA